MTRSKRYCLSKTFPIQRRLERASDLANESSFFRVEIDERHESTFRWPDSCFLSLGDFKLRSSRFTLPTMKQIRLTILQMIHITRE
jgi:hypothetical protein